MHRWQPFDRCSEGEHFAFARIHGKQAFRTRGLATVDDMSKTEKGNGSNVRAVSDGGLNN